MHMGARKLTSCCMFGELSRPNDDIPGDVWCSQVACHLGPVDSVVGCAFRTGNPRGNSDKGYVARRYQCNTRPGFSNVTIGARRRTLGK